MTAEPNEPEVDALEQLLEPGNEAALREFLDVLHPADLADLLGGVPAEDRLRVFRTLDPARGGDVLPELPPAAAQDLVASLGDSELLAVLDTIETDDAADLLEDLPGERRARLLALRSDGGEQLAELLRYPADTAGGLMQTELVRIRDDLDVGHAIAEVRIQGRDVEEFHRLFLVDGDGRYIGAVALDAVVLADATTPIRELVDDRTPVVPATLDQEEVARIFEKYDPVSVAVVDADERLLGRIVVDDIVDVIEEEANEDILLMAGMSDTEPLETERMLPAARARLSWLLVTFSGGLLNAVFMRRFGRTIEETAAVVFFLPLVIALGGGVGSQTATLTTRAIALGRVGMTSLGPSLAREAAMGLMLGSILGALLAVVSITWFGEPSLGLVLSTSMVLCITVAAAMGVVTPIAFERFGIDPALAAGPIVTISNDIIGVLIYLTVATLVLSPVHAL